MNKPPTSGQDSSVSSLVSYALDGLRRCWLPEARRYSYRYRLDGSVPANESIAERDAFYTLNVLLGFSKIPHIAQREHSNIEVIFAGCCREAGNPNFRAYAHGMALWAGAELGLAPPGKLVDKTTSLLGKDRDLRALTAQDVGMLASGAIAMAAKEGGKWRDIAERLAAHLRRHHYDPATHLFYNQGRGLRRRFSSFASQVYSLLALYQFGEAFDVDWALRLANRGAAKLVALQGRRGEWPWFYYVPSGRVVDFYEIYSVHQHGMAPAFLHHAVTHGVPDARSALVRGFNWLFDDNEMGVSMLRPAEKMFYRSQVREGELDSVWPRARRSTINALLGRCDAVERHRGLTLRKECRSYELGWILWSFGARSGYEDLTERTEFSV